MGVLAYFFTIYSQSYAIIVFINDAFINIRFNCNIRIVCDLNRIVPAVDGIFILNSDDYNFTIIRIYTQGYGIFIQNFINNLHKNHLENYFNIKLNIIPAFNIIK